MRRLNRLRRCGSIVVARFVSAAASSVPPVAMALYRLAPVGSSLPVFSRRRKVSRLSIKEWIMLLDEVLVYTTTN